MVAFEKPLLAHIHNQIISWIIFLFIAFVFIIFFYKVDHISNCMTAIKFIPYNTRFIF